MSQTLNLTLLGFPIPASPRARTPWLDVFEASAPPAEWIVPAVKEVTLALALSGHSVRWRSSRGLRSEEVSAGTVSICPFNQSRSFDVRSGAQVAAVLLRNEALQQVRQETRPDIGADLEAHDFIQDVTLRRLVEILVHEKRAGFQSGVFFLDGLATALASHLVYHYANFPPVEMNFTGGMAPSALRRCMEFMEAHLRGELRLSELAREAGMSASHFIRSFRRSTGKTPYQFLLHRRVERARSLMGDHRISLAEVAAGSGFADQHHFARVFRRITGLTPSSYRRSI
jgi:AraC family transcriptional regulator